MLKRDLILNNLDIILWKLKYPIVLLKNAPILLLINIRLLIVSDVLISLDDSFVLDVIRTMNLNVTEAYIITADKINLLVFSSRSLDYCWLVGIEMLCNFCSMTFKTPTLSILKHDIHAKRDLWYQIDRYFQL